MDSRPVLQGKKLRIFIDSESFSHLLNKDNKTAKKILTWTDTTSHNVLAKYLEFSRSPFDTEYDELDNIKPFQFKLNKNFERQEFDLRNVPGSWTFTHEMTEFTCKNILNTQNLDPKQDKITSLMINFIEYVGRDNGNEDLDSYRIFRGISTNTNLLITENKVLLKLRRKFEESLKGNTKYSEMYPISIVSVDEAAEIIDFFFKFRNEYFSGNVRFSEYLWYWSSFRLKIPNFHGNNQWTNAFANRFYYLLKSIDEMGIQYYLGITNETQLNIIYHFNYFISLVTGIFDNLALITDEKYSMELGGNKQKISLNSNNRTDFMKKLKFQNKELWEHIINGTDLIKLVYEFRDTIIHREMFSRSFLKYGRMEFNVLKIDDGLLEFLTHCDCDCDKTKRLEKWGVHKFGGQDKLYFLEPFTFSKSIAKMLIPFSNKYLELLGYTNYLEDLKNENPNDQFLRMIGDFGRGRLSFDHI